MRSALTAFALATALTVPGAVAQQPHVFAVQGDHFTLDGKPFQVISGSIHYTRIPRAYWRDRLKKARAMGLNTIETYAFWNAHEPAPVRFDFTGQNDIAEFVREAQQEGLYVILRPGPYACAEWEFGGYPRLAAQGPAHGRALHLRALHGSRKPVPQSARSATGTVTDRQRRPHPRRAG